MSLLQDLLKVYSDKTLRESLQAAEARRATLHKTLAEVEAQILTFRNEKTRRHNLKARKK